MDPSKLVTLSSIDIISRRNLRDIVAELKVKHANLKSRDEKFRSWFSTMLASEFHYHRPCSVLYAVDDGVANVDCIVDSVACTVGLLSCPP